MAMFETWLKADLKNMVSVVKLNGNMFSADSNGNLIGVVIMDGGEPAEGLEGVVTGYIIRPDGGTLIVTGTLEGNRASIVLPESAYVYVGQLSIVIKVGGTTVGACTGYVYKTSTDTIVDPGHIIPSLDELLQKIADCEQATTDANDAADLANEKADLANTKAELANEKAELADEKATLADEKATAANNAADLANTKAAMANEKATLANEKALLADEKAGLANDAADLANEMAALANQKAIAAESATTAANTAAQKITGMTVEASGLSPEQDPTATITEVNGHKHIAFGIPAGATGERGKDFHIKRTFASIAEMEAYDPGQDQTYYKVEEFDYVMIDTGSVQDPDTGKLYCYEPSTLEVWRYIGDLSGSQGIKGETGNGIDSVLLNQNYTLTITMTDGTSYTTPSIRGQQGETGPRGVGVVNIIANDNYTLTFELEDGTSYTTGSMRGATGAKGDTGDTGNGIASALLNGNYTLTLTFTDGTSYTTGSIRGATGETGNGIASAVLNSDYTLTLTFTDGTSYTTGSIRGATGVKGDTGDTGNGIASTVLNSDYTLTITMTDGTSYTTSSIRGAVGATGNGIASAVLNNDYTLTLTFTDGTSYTTGSIRGATGETGNGIASVLMNQDYTLTITMTDGTSYTTGNIRGATGAKGETGDTGNGISGVSFDSTTHTLTISFTDGTSYTTGSIQGDTGATPNLTIGTITTIEPDQQASATITGTPENPVLNLSLPRGQTGQIENVYATTIPMSSSDSTTIFDAIESKGLTILSYGNSTWQDFIDAYNNNAIVYCRASSNSNPASGSQTRLAFMAYVNNASTPTEVEFQYYRSVSSHSASQQGDQVYVYKLTSANSGTWTVTKREASCEIVAGDNLTSSYSNDVLTLSVTTPDSTPTSESTKLVTSGGVYTALDDKAPKANPVFTGSISMGRTDNTTVGTNSVAVGEDVVASGNYSHAEGYGNESATKTIGNTTYTGTGAHGTQSHAEGYQTWAIGAGSHAEGGGTTASGTNSHAEGANTTASIANAHAEGAGTIASGYNSHAEGNTTTASGDNSHAEGLYTLAKNRSQHVFGEYNVADPSTASSSTKGNYVEIVGNGTGSNASSNARALDWNGNEYLNGDLYINCNDNSTGGNKVISSADVMTGATSSAAGSAGLVPAPLAGDAGKVLMGDGTWGTVVTDVMTGATSTAAGAAGLVPAPSAGDENKVLKGDGTWGTADPGQAATIITVTGSITGSGSYSGTISDASVTADMIPIRIQLGTPSAFLDGNITVTCGNGSVTVTCPNVSGTSTITIYLFAIMQAWQGGDY